MAIAIHSESKTTQLAEEPFKNESELQACLERSPYLLVGQSEPKIATVQREVRLPYAGILDLLAVDAEGLPVAVEVKLARNSQSRREVVAQAFDYVADLSRLTFEELDDIVDGGLASALGELGSAEEVGRLQKRCATNLRAGNIRLVIAVDSAGDDLIRIVRYINDHSDIDVRLVCVSKFDKGRIFVPRVMVARTSEIRVRSGSRKKLDPFLAEVVEAYDEHADSEWQCRGSGLTYRQIYPDGWSSGVHYEFQNYSDEIGIELHLESDEVKDIGARLSSFAGEELVSGVVLEWDPGWFRNRGRLISRVGKNQSPKHAVKAMETLISRTRELILENLPKY